MTCGTHVAAVAGIALLLTNCPHVRALDTSACRHITNAVGPLIARFGASLELLGLSAIAPASSLFRAAAVQKKRGDAAAAGGATIAERPTSARRKLLQVAQPPQRARPESALMGAVHVIPRVSDDLLGCIAAASAACRNLRRVLLNGQLITDAGVDACCSMSNLTEVRPREGEGGRGRSDRSHVSWQRSVCVTCARS